MIDAPLRAGRSRQVGARPFRGTPVVESQNHARVFAPEPRAAFGKQPLTTYKFMKPTPKISDNQTSFPLTDCNYKPTTDAKVSASQKVATLTGFHKLSSDLIGKEMVRDYVTEFSAFTIIALISAWPICLSIVAIVRMLRA